jgi:inhibitor of cysteine peptidase
MKRKMIVLLVTSLILCGVCPGFGQTVQLIGSDAGRTINLRIGDCLNIVLNGNPTTGYIWEESSRTAPVLKQYKRMEFVPQSKLIGAGGKCTFYYKAVARGTTELKLVYRRPWEKKVPPLRAFAVKVTVKL